MEAEYRGRVHSGGLPTPIVHKYNPYLIWVVSQLKKYKVHGYEVPSRAIRGEVNGLCHHQHILFGV
jgi:hypothetical protein